jgi:hypothetical protein
MNNCSGDTPDTRAPMGVRPGSPSQERHAHAGRPHQEGIEVRAEQVLTGVLVQAFLVGQQLGDRPAALFGSGLQITTRRRLAKVCGSPDANTARSAFFRRTGPGSDDVLGSVRLSFSTRSSTDSTLSPYVLRPHVLRPRRHAADGAVPTPDETAASHQENWRSE